VSVKNHSDLTGNINSNVDSNGSDNITGPILNEVLQNLADSAVNLLGDTLQGKLTYASIFPLSSNGDIPHKKYVDDLISGLSGTYVSKTGDTMSGDLNLGGNDVSNINGINTGSTRAIGVADRTLNDQAGKPVVKFDTIASGVGINSDPIDPKYVFIKSSNISADRTAEHPDKDFTYAGIDDIQLLTHSGATASGTDTYSATITPAITAYVEWQRFYIKFTNANTGASTINLNSLGAKSIVKNGSTALSASDINAGQILCLVYDGTNFQIV
jgi:hypothetical protein